MSQLKKMCRDSWLDEDGDKDDLIERLVDYERPAGGLGSKNGRAATPKQRERRKRQEYGDMTSNELKAKCRDFGLSIYGTRDALVDRLLEEGPSDDSHEDTDEDDEHVRNYPMWSEQRAMMDEDWDAHSPPQEEGSTRIYSRRQGEPEPRERERIGEIMARCGFL